MAPTPGTPPLHQPGARYFDPGPVPTTSASSAHLNSHYASPELAHPPHLCTPVPSGIALTCFIPGSQGQVERYTGLRRWIRFGIPPLLCLAADFHLVREYRSAPQINTYRQHISDCQHILSLVGGCEFSLRPSDFIQDGPLSTSQSHGTSHDLHTAVNKRSYSDRPQRRDRANVGPTPLARTQPSAVHEPSRRVILFPLPRSSHSDTISYPNAVAFFHLDVPAVTQQTVGVPNRFPHPTTSFPISKRLSRLPPPLQIPHHSSTGFVEGTVTTNTLTMASSAGSALAAAPGSLLRARDSMVKLLMDIGHLHKPSLQNVLLNLVDEVSCDPNTVKIIQQNVAKELQAQAATKRHPVSNPPPPATSEGSATRRRSATKRRNVARPVHVTATSTRSLERPVLASLGSLGEPMHAGKSYSEPKTVLNLHGLRN
ncbi:hypothetical protein EDB80DRAFT_693347 [Ilyonectria destructans]|nr:hypothetical protein EDB80DRAFT_693347 [Ilyonectria destructans]